MMKVVEGLLEYVQNLLRWYLKKEENNDLNEFGKGALNSLERVESELLRLKRAHKYGRKDITH